jgi:hypothetical protein
LQAVAGSCRQAVKQSARVHGRRRQHLNGPQKRSSWRNSVNKTSLKFPKNSAIAKQIERLFAASAILSQFCFEVTLLWTQFSSHLRNRSASLWGSRRPKTNGSDVPNKFFLSLSLLHASHNFLALEFSVSAKYPTVPFDNQ